MFDKARHLDKKHVVFGKMINDDDNILKRIESEGSKSGVPKSMVSIVECGEIGGKSISSKKRSRSRSRSLPKRVNHRSDGLIGYKRNPPPSDSRKYSSMS